MFINHSFDVGKWNGLKNQNAGKLDPIVSKRNDSQRRRVAFSNSRFIIFFAIAAVQFNSAAFASLD
jgi:hypothetical protein